MGMKIMIHMPKMFTINTKQNAFFIHKLTWILNIHVSFLSFVIFTSIFHVPPSISSNLPPL
jgi:hypothetical protein